MPRLSIIVAMSKNRTIGCKGKLPWRLSADLKRFKSLTMGHHIVMGRRTFDSIGLPLPGRITIVLRRRASPYDFEFFGEGAKPLRLYGGDRSELSANRTGMLPLAVAHDLDEALALARDDDEVFVIGGAEIYALTLPRADRLYVTWVDAEVEGDTFFPVLDVSQWRLISEESHPPDAKNEYPTRFAVYDRITDQ